MEHVSFEAHMYLDPLYWQLKQLARSDAPKGGITQMIDEATGYAAHLEQKNIEHAIFLLQEIIKYKKKFGIATQSEKKVLADIQKLELAK